MNEDEMQAMEPLAGEELERQLARYARLRLDPNPAQVRRARSHVLEAAWRRRFADPRHARPVADSAAPGVAAAFPAVARRPFGRWGARRLMATLAAAVMAGLVVGSSAFAASRAGGPLYAPRLLLEELTLPGDPDARMEAELALAQTRLAEAVEATGRGDQRAVDAALAAYAGTIDTLAGLPGGPSDRALDALQAHREVLLRLLDSAPAPAISGLENALVHSGQVIDRLGGGGSAGSGANGGGSNAGGTTTGGSNPGGGSDPSGGSNAGGGGSDPGGGSNAGGGGSKPEKPVRSQEPDEPAGGKGGGPEATKAPPGGSKHP